MHFHFLPVCQLILGSAFLYAGIGKLAMRSSLSEAIAAYGVIPARLVPTAAGLLGPAEITLAVLCLAGLLLPYVAAVITILLVAFTVSTVINLRMGRKIPCACFGSHSGAIGPSSVARNMILLLLSCALFVAVAAQDGSGVIWAHRQWSAIANPGDLSTALLEVIAGSVFIRLLVSMVDVLEGNFARSAGVSRKTM